MDKNNKKLPHLNFGSHMLFKVLDIDLLFF